MLMSDQITLLIFIIMYLHDQFNMDDYLEAASFVGLYLSFMSHQNFNAPICNLVTRFCYCKYCSCPGHKVMKGQCFLNKYFSYGVAKNMQLDTYYLKLRQKLCKAV